MRIWRFMHHLIYSFAGCFGIILLLFNPRYNINLIYILAERVIKVKEAKRKNFEFPELSTSDIILPPSTPGRKYSIPTFSINIYVLFVHSGFCILFYRNICLIHYDIRHESLMLAPNRLFPSII